MAAFSRFAELPTELRLLVWEAAIPRSPSVQFLSYPRPADTAADNAGGSRQNQWQSEIPNAQRTITASEDPGLGEPNKQMGSFERHSSYMSSLALLHACRESRGVCLAQSNSSSTVSIGPCASIPINPNKDIICIQDSTSRLPWASLQQLRLSPDPSPLRIAFDRHLPLDCKFKYCFRNGRIHVRCDCMMDWMVHAPPMCWSDNCFIATLGCQCTGNNQKVIYVLDYDIKPKHAIVQDTSGTDVQGVRWSRGSQEQIFGSSAVKLSVQIPNHNGKFHGHGVTFYALPNTRAFVEWNIPQKALLSRASLVVHLASLYDYRVGHDFESVTKGTERISTEFLACVRD